MVPRQSGGAATDPRALILGAIDDNEKKGGAAYASGKPLVVFVNADPGEWYPNRVARALPYLRVLSSKFVRTSWTFLIARSKTGITAFETRRDFIVPLKAALGMAGLFKRAMGSIDADLRNLRQRIMQHIHLRSARQINRLCPPPDVNFPRSVLDRMVRPLLGSNATASRPTHSPPKGNGH